jgi:sugar fermentation stimulation protein A
MTLLHRYGRLFPGTLIRRYKRFLADVRLEDGRVITAFTPNSGSMKTCSDPGSPVMLLHDPKPGRKTEYNLEIIRSGSTWVGVNTGLANTLGAGIIDAGLTGHPQLEGFRVLRREVTYGDSRFDLKISRGGEKGFVEIKNVTYRSDSTALFPDAVTTRGKKHLETLMHARSEGYTACNLYIVQRSDCRDFTPARKVDPVYARTFDRAFLEGVIMIAGSARGYPVQKHTSVWKRRGVESVPSTQEPGASSDRT